MPGLFRLLVIALVVGGVFYIYRRLKIAASSSRQSRAPLERSTQAVKCEFCGLHIPEDEAIRRDNHLYCCQEHADRAARQQH